MPQYLILGSRIKLIVKKCVRLSFSPNKAYGCCCAPLRVEGRLLLCGQCCKSGRLALWKTAVTLYMEISSAAFCNRIKTHCITSASGWRSCSKPLSLSVTLKSYSIIDVKRYFFLTVSVMYPCVSQVWDFDKFSRHTLLGGVRVPLGKLNVSYPLELHEDLQLPQKVHHVLWHCTNKIVYNVMSKLFSPFSREERLFLHVPL